MQESVHYSHFLTRAYVTRVSHAKTSRRYSTIDPQAGKKEMENDIASRLLCVFFLGIRKRESIRVLYLLYRVASGEVRICLNKRAKI